MASQSKPFTPEEMKAELRKIVWSFAESLGYVYGNSRTPALLLPPGFTAKELDDVEIDTFDLDSLPITQDMEELYQYAINGIQVREDFGDAYENSRDFIRGLEGFDLLWENRISDVPITKCRHVVEVANARLVLANGGSATLANGDMLFNHLTLSQVALLAGLDERTVRNATTPKAKDRLATVNFGGRTFVENSVAIEWLKRRGFKETVYMPQGHQRDLKGGFHSATDLGAFLVMSREALELSQEELAQRANIEASWLTDMESGKLDFDKDDCIRLAEALNLSPNDFTLAVFMVHQDVEATRIKAELM